MRHLNFLRRFHLKMDIVKAPNKPNQRPQIQLLEQVDLFRQNHRPVRVLRKSTNVSYLACESTNVRTGRLVDSCVPVSVERSDTGEDADENVDADQVRMGRPVGSEQSIDLFTQLEEIDIDFRVSGLPHSVVKQAENFRVRELVKKIESHHHRQALQADLQQSSACNPFSEKSKKMIRDMGNVELFVVMPNNSQRCTAQNAFFIGIKE